MTRRTTARRSVCLILLLAVAAFPLAPASAATLPQDDAGSGRDAPDAPAPDVGIEAGRAYDGRGEGSLDPMDHYWFAVSGPADVEVAFSGTPVCVVEILDAAGNALPQECFLVEGVMRYKASVPSAGTYYLRVESQGAPAYRFALGVGGPAPPLVSLGPAPAIPGADPTCGTGAGVTATSGEANGVVYAALKTGFRAVVAWSTPTPTVATLRYSVDGGAEANATEPTPRQHHVFVLDSLPQGRALCFTPLDAAGAQVAPPQALRLANAMTAYDAAAGAYTVNLLVVANENVRARHLVREGVDVFAERLHDASDGHLRVGRVVLLFADAERANTGTHSCYYPGVLVAGGLLMDGPTCDRAIDVVFAHDSCAGGAACADLDGIQEPGGFIMMNSVFQASPILGEAVWDEKEVGAVLTHEFGHYAFAAMDLYAGADCWDPAKGLSVMGASRLATELDDAVNRCPNEASIVGYVPAWESLRSRFPLVPDRAGVIDEGPHGGGGAYALRAFEFVSVPEAAQDDAGSGRDAGSDRAGAVSVDAGVVYAGTLLPPLDARDVYRLDAPAGAVVHVALWPAALCPVVQDADGQGIPSTDCALLVENGQIRASFTAPGGPVHLVVSEAAGGYRFAMGIDEPAPSAAPV